MTLARPVVLLAALTALLTSCDSEASDDAGATGSDTVATQPTRIVATAADGTSVAFEDFTVTCRPSEEDQPEAQIVTATSGWDFASPGPTKPAMLIEAADTADGTTVDLPLDEVWGEEETFIVGFITQVGKEDELSASEEPATGEIEVISASCEPEPHLEVRIDGTFGSEVADAGVTVEGHLSADPS